MTYLNHRFAHSYALSCGGSLSLHCKSMKVVSYSPV